MARLTTQGEFKDYWRADDATRPYFHPSDADLPAISLLNYSEIANPPNRSRALAAMKRSLNFEVLVTADQNNPFEYARQLVKMGDGKVRIAYFFPHDTEAAPWWEAENARLASLASAARLALPSYADDWACQIEA